MSAAVLEIVPRLYRAARSQRPGVQRACSGAPVLAVIDGDMQHDETALPKMVEAIVEDGKERYRSNHCPAAMPHHITPSQGTSGT